MNKALLVTRLVGLIFISTLITVFLSSKIYALPYGQGGYSECQYQSCTDENGSANTGGEGGTSQGDDTPGTPDSGGFFKSAERNTSEVYEKSAAYWPFYLLFISGLVFMVWFILGKRRKNEEESQLSNDEDHPGRT